MSIIDLTTKFRARLEAYTPIVHLLEDSDSGLPTNQKATLNAAHVYLTNAGFIDETNLVAVVEQGRFSHDYVAASTTRTLGGVGAVGDFLHRLIILPSDANPGAITLADGGGTARTILPATAALDDLTPIVIEFNAVCSNTTTPGWKVVTLTNAAVWAIGRFTS
ncbi:MAG: hypothetical protein AB7U18_19150 [Dehalococcoidia bacterium]